MRFGRHRAECSDLQTRSSRRASPRLHCRRSARVFGVSVSTKHLLCRRYAAALYWAVTTMSTTGYGDILPMTNLERSYALVVMLIGVVVSALVFGVLGQIITDAFDSASAGAGTQNQVCATRSPPRSAAMCPPPPRLVAPPADLAAAPSHPRPA